MFSGKFGGQFRRNLTGGDRGLLGGDLFRSERLLMLVKFRHRLAIVDGVLDELLDGVEVGVADRGQLDRRQIEVVLDPVLDAHRHQRIQSQFDQRNLPGEVLGLVPHGAADDRGQPVMHRFDGIRRPLTQIGGHPGACGETVVQNFSVIDGYGFNGLSHRHTDRDPGRYRRRQTRRRTRPADDGVVDQRE